MRSPTFPDPTLDLSDGVLTVARALHPAGPCRPDSLADLEAIAGGLAAVADEFELDQHEPARSYRRVLSTPAYDAWIIRWKPTADLDLHDHGGSSGVVRVVVGAMAEKVGDRSAEGPLRWRDVPTGGSIVIRPTTVHGIVNLGPADAVSVHVYSPPLRSMTFYEERGGELAAVRVADQPQA